MTIHKLHLVMKSPLSLGEDEGEGFNYFLIQLKSRHPESGWIQFTMLCFINGFQ